MRFLIGILLGAVIGWWVASGRVSDHSTEELMRELYRRCSFEIWTIVAVFVTFHSPYYWTILRWFFRLPKKYWVAIRKDCDTIVGSVNPIYVPEKFVEGSDYVDGVRPAFQVAIYAQDSPSRWIFRGEGWRLGEFLVTAAHVIDDATGVVRVRADEAYVDVPVDKFNHHELDLATTILSLPEWASLAVKSAKVPKTAVNNFQVVTCYSRGKYSTGVCSAYQAMPHVVYDGSTRSGCSGAPLYVGTTVYAMHVGAGKVNLGLDANWIQSVSFNRESTDDFIFDKIYDQFAKTGQKTKYKAFDSDEIYVLSNGRYYTFDVADLPNHVREALEFESSYPSRYECESTPRVTYDRSDAPSLNLKGASASAEARKLKVSAPVVNPNSQVQFALSDLKEKKTEPTDGLESMSAQLKEVLNYIQESRTVSKPILGGVRKKSSKKPKPAPPKDLKI